MIEIIKTAVFFAVGIYLYDVISPGFAVIFIVSLILVLLAKAALCRRFSVGIFLAGLFLVLGVILCSYASDVKTKPLYEYAGRYVTLTGRICEIPADGGDENVQYYIDVRRVSHNGAEKEIREKILLTTPERFRYGDTVTFEGFVEETAERINENSYDYALYYKTKGVFFKVYSETISIPEEKIKDYTPYALWTGVKSFASDIIDENYKGDYAAILKAVLIGNKKEFSDEFEALLRRTGLMRFYYPAFLHVMLFMSLISLVLGHFSRNKRDAASILLLLLYAAANFSSVGFVKLSLILALFTFWRNRFGRAYYLDILGAAAIIMGVINPLIFYDRGFIFSITSSVLIYYFFDTVEKRFKSIKPKQLRRSVSIGVICGVGLTPLVIYFYGEASSYSIWISCFMLPFTALILILSPLLIACLTLFHHAPVIRQITNGALAALRYLPELADKLPYSKINFESGHELLLIIYLFLLIAAVKHIKGKKEHERTALMLAAAFTLSAVVCAVCRTGDVEITFVSVGQGDGAVITAPHRCNILIDGGGGTEYSDYNPGEAVYLEYLLAEGITEVDSAYVSHYHQDHVQGIIAAMENIKVRNLFLPDEMEGSEWRLALENAAAENGTTVHYISEETIITYNNGLRIRAIPPTEKARISGDENDTSYVYLVEYSGFSALFTGDMSFFAELCLIDAGKAPDADLLKVAHHGSASATSREWVEAVSPEYAIISVGADNNYDFPRDSVLENLSGTKLFRTDLNGDIHFTIHKNGKTDIHTFR